MNKLKLGLYWGAGCGGCEIAFLEIHEKILTLLERVEIVFAPCFIDVKYADLRAMPDGSIDACFYNGAIRNDENEAIARLLRRKSKLLIAYGACAVMGGIPGLANMHTAGEILERIYKTTESTDNPSGILPEPSSSIAEGRDIELAEVRPQAKALRQVVAVDYFMPGCPPTEKQTWRVCEDLVEGRLPLPGSIVGAGERSVCAECPREKRGTKIKAFKRPHEVTPDGETCLLEQGLLCMGPATRSGCEALCPRVNMPCRGCYGPAGREKDQGAQMIGVLGSVIDHDDDGALSAALESVIDPAGTFYRFSLPTSSLGRSRSPARKRRLP